MTMSYVRFPYEELGPPAKTPIKPVNLRTADEWKADAMMSNLYPSVVDNISVFTPTRTERVRAEKTKQAEGCDTGLAPVYFRPPASEPAVGDYGPLWYEDRGREGRKIIGAGAKAKGSSRDGGGGGGPDDVRPAGLESNEILGAKNRTRTGLKLKKDCWGNVIPQ
ncbi:predicted protein [Micromonas commoda]|uniref:Uncharacterized protein n=1 Tax=Micromonas commoda (strain RCC299 / NOUM17 / CCMP2709) TaxID=296587 RepID=C1E7X8_MICCC|nr:predicted protein [Micromonas commoda]ACO64056.1 predicted protein [Micromonas commoda]|eukprot:XP_002502798.1 predicted protein [Micromonas commoda]